MKPNVLRSDIDEADCICLEKNINDDRTAPTINVAVEKLFN